MLGGVRVGWLMDCCGFGVLVRVLAGIWVPVAGGIGFVGECVEFVKWGEGWK